MSSGQKAGWHAAKHRTRPPQGREGEREGGEGQVVAAGRCPAAANCTHPVEVATVHLSLGSVAAADWSRLVEVTYASFLLLRHA